jgi:hypothetical protein
VLKNTSWTLVAVLLFLRSPRARAEPGDAVGQIIVGGVLYGGVTLGFTIADVVGDRSASYGRVEAAINAPLAAVWGWQTARNAGMPGHQLDLGYVAITAWHTALAIHGVYEAARCRSASAQPPGMINVGGVRGVVGPLPLHDGAGLAISGSF